MPMPDERRERGGQTAGTQQTQNTFTPQALDISPMGGGAVNAGPQLQINPNQARVVKTGGELANIFAGVAGGIQKGIAAYEQMEKTVEAARWNDFETSYLTQFDAVKGDPQKMRDWFQDQDYKPGRHTKKQYWGLRSQVNGKAYEDDQMDWLNDTLMRSSKMPNETERNRYLQQQLDLLDDNSPAYGKLHEVVMGNNSRVAAKNYKMSLDMITVEKTAATQDAVRRIIDNGANPDIVNNEYFKTILRARNVGAVDVNETGVVSFKGQPIDLNSLTPELDAQIRAAAGEAMADLGDPDLAAAQFGAIGFDEGFLAAARQSRRGDGDALTDAFANATAAGWGTLDDSGPASMVTFLQDAVDSGKTGDDAWEATSQVWDRFVKDVRENPNLTPQQKIKTLQRLQQSLLDGTADAAWEQAGKRHGVDGDFLTPERAKRLNREIRGALEEEAVQYFDTQAPSLADPRFANDYEAYAKAMNTFIYDNAGMFSLFSDDAEIAFTSKDRTEFVPASDVRDHIARLGTSTVVSGISFMSPGAGPTSISLGETGLVTFHYTGDGNEEIMSTVRQPPRTDRAKALEDLRKGYEWSSGQVLNNPKQAVDTRADYAATAIKNAVAAGGGQKLETAIQLLAVDPYGPEILDKLAGDADVRPHIEAFTRQVFTHRPNEPMDVFMERTRAWAGLGRRMDTNKRNAMFGIDPGAAKGTLTREKTKDYMLAEYGDIILDDNYPKDPDGRLTPEAQMALDQRLGAAVDALRFAQTYPTKAEAALHTSIDYMVAVETGDSSAATKSAGYLPGGFTTEAAAAFGNTIIDWARKETGRDDLTFQQLRDEENPLYLRAIEAVRDFETVYRTQLDYQQPLAAGSEASFLAASLTPKTIERALDTPKRPSIHNANLETYEMVGGGTVPQGAVRSMLTDLGLNLDEPTSSDDPRFQEWMRSRAKAGTIVRAMLPPEFFRLTNKREVQFSNEDAVKFLRGYAEGGPEGALAQFELTRKMAMGDGDQSAYAKRRYAGLQDAAYKLKTLFKYKRGYEYDNDNFNFIRNEEGSPTGMYTTAGYHFELDPNAFQSASEEAAVVAGEYSGRPRQNQTPIRIQVGGPGYDRTKSWYEIMNSKPSEFFDIRRFRDEAERQRQMDQNAGLSPNGTGIPSLAEDWDYSK